MEYMGDRDWWNARFKVRELSVMRHEKCLSDDMKYFDKQGKILDVACGDGRNAIYLARLGYEVLAIDFSEEALKRLSYFAQKESLNIKTQWVDLSKTTSLSDLDGLQGMIINHYRLKPQCYSALMNQLNEGGILWVNGFSEAPPDNPHITESDLLVESDFVALERYKLEDKKAYAIDQRKFVRYIWRK